MLPGKIRCGSSGKTFGPNHAGASQRCIREGEGNRLSKDTRGSCKDQVAIGCRGNRVTTAMPATFFLEPFLNPFCRKQQKRYISAPIASQFLADRSSKISMARFAENKRYNKIYLSLLFRLVV